MKQRLHEGRTLRLVLSVYICVGGEERDKYKKIYITAVTRCLSLCLGLKALQ